MEVMKKAKPQDIVYHYVKNQIVGKSMFPGNRIIEDDIIRETGTSRTSIRPALLRLKYEGLVEMIPNRGAFVAKPSEEDLRQVYRVREVLECGMMEDAIRNRTEAQLRAMEKSLKNQEVLTQHYSRQEYVTMNHVFHWLVVEASANKYYEKYLNELYNKINTYMIFYDQSSDNNSIVSHTMIYEALRDRDLEKGLAGIREDIQIAWEDMRKINVPSGGRQRRLLYPGEQRELLRGHRHRVPRPVLGPGHRRVRGGTGGGKAGPCGKARFHRSAPGYRPRAGAAPVGATGAGGAGPRLR